jgi:DNA-directed RNA polymerase specialized sigma24 family protein
MYIPEGFTEAQVVTAITNISQVLGPNFAFGYFSADDIAQEAAQFAIEALPRYDPKGWNEDGTPKRPLENFLYTHARNRILNLKRNKFHRTDPPCKVCASGGQHVDGEQCKKFKDWLKRNRDKQHLVKPLPLDGISDEKEPTTRREATVVDDTANNEVLDIIDAQLPVELRAAYLQMRSNESASVPKSRRRQVEKAISDILKKAGVLPEDDDG